jgi:hypothetical protein
MAQSIQLEAYKAIEKEFGQAIAERVTSLLTFSFDIADKKVEQIAIQKKLELKDELSKDLASKADIAIVRQKIELVEQKLELVEQRIELVEKKLDSKLTVWSTVIIAVVLITNQNAIQLLAQLLGLMK